MVIWKHQLAMTSALQEVMLPKGAEIVYVREQNNKMCFWYLCDPDTHKVPRYFWVVGTGDRVAANTKYRGSVSLDEGRFIFHVLEQLA